jgi:hypothetical protein
VACQISKCHFSWLVAVLLLPIAVRAGSVTSNVATVSIAAAGGSCLDPPDWPASDIDDLGTIVVSHLDFGPFGPNDMATGIVERYDWPAGALSPGKGQSVPGGLLGLGTASFTNVGHFTGTGLDFGVIIYERATQSRARGLGAGQGPRPTWSGGVNSRAVSYFA